MKLSEMFGVKTKTLATKKPTPSGLVFADTGEPVPPGLKIVNAMPKRRKPGEFPVKWAKVEPQKIKDYKAIVTKAELVEYLQRCEETGLAGFDWETAASVETRQAWQDFQQKNQKAHKTLEDTNLAGGMTEKEYAEAYSDLTSAFNDEKVKYLKSPLDPHRGDICTASISAAAHESRVIPISHTVGKVFEPMLSREEARKVFMDTIDRHLFRNDKIIKIAVNMAFETKYAAKYGKYIQRPVADPLMMWVRCLQIVAPSRLINPAKPFTGWGLKPTTKKIFGVEMNDFMTLLEKNNVEFFDEIDASQGVGMAYSAEDSDYAVQHYLYWDAVAKQIELPADCPNNNYSEWLRNVEMPFTRVIGLMEYHGMHWDAERADVLRETAIVGQEKAANEIKRIVKEALGIDVAPGKTGKTKSVKEALFQHMKVPQAAQGKTGPALDEEAMIDIKFMLANKLENLDEEKYLATPLPEGWESLDPETDPHMEKAERMAVIIAKRSPHPYAEQAGEMLDHMVLIQKYSTLLSSHIVGREKYLNPVSGRIHSGYGPWTATGRLSSSSPNAQNVPRLDNDTLGVRSLYQARPGKIMFFIDFSGFELRIMAWRAGDEVMIDLFNSGGDMHRRTASVLAEKPEEEVTKKERTDAKPGNFGIAYGGTEYALQKTYKTDYGMRKSLDFCAAVVNAVKTAYAGIPRFQREVAVQAREDGWVSTALGFMRLLPDINSTNRRARGDAERQASNTPIQGGAADFMKVAQNDTYDAIGYGTAARHDFFAGNPVMDDADQFQLYNIKQDFPLAHGETDMIAQIHDEMIFEMDDDADVVERAGALIKEYMERPPLEGFPVPIEAESTVGYRWSDKMDINEWKAGKSA